MFSSYNKQYHTFFSCGVGAAAHVPRVPCKQAVDEGMLVPAPPAHVRERAQKAPSPSFPFYFERAHLSFPDLAGYRTVQVN